MAYSWNKFLSLFDTLIKECVNNKQERNNLLKEMSLKAINNIIHNAPHHQNYIILY